MKPAFQKNAVLMADIRRAVETGSRRLWWLGQSGFLVVQNGRAVLLDPYLSDSLTRKYARTDKPHVRLTERVIDPETLATMHCIDLVTSSHVHTDHLDAETLVPILKANPQARLVHPMAIDAAVRERVGAWVVPQLLPVDADSKVHWQSLIITGIPAAHNELEKDEAGHCRFLGFVLEWSGWTLYHSGDTLLHPGLLPALSPFEIDVAFLPINGNRPERRVAGNLSGREAAQLACNLEARLVVPCHFDLFEFNTATPDEFRAECERLNQPCRVLATGEGLTL